MDSFKAVSDKLSWYNRVPKGPLGGLMLGGCGGLVRLGGMLWSSGNGGGIKLPIKE
ncbi:hypothetical protein M1558_00125 [Candidatus Parvarchaeota archaeon]|nr:hypothetical protein [Candidatus Parvarchaeota archaeon]